VVRVRLAYAVAVVLAIGSPMASGARSVALQQTSSQIIAELNALRAANGLPKVAQNRVWDKACHLHDLYMSDNSVETHDEQRGRSGYTAAGAFAGRNADLALTSWSDGNPWASAPLHLVQLMSPALRDVGAYQYTDPGGRTWTCMTTWPGYAEGKILRSRAQQMYTYPGNGQHGVPTATVAYEAPVVPNGWVGLPTTDNGYRGDVTGPFIYLYWVGPAPPPNPCYTGPDLKLCVDDGVPVVPSAVSARLVGPTGKVVGSRLISQGVARKAGHAGLLPPGAAVLVAVKPLAPRTTYTVEVHFAIDRAGANPCPWGVGELRLSPTWCLPKYPPFSARLHFTTATA
jgi:hypothetical protein